MSKIVTRLQSFRPVTSTETVWSHRSTVQMTAERDLQTQYSSFEDLRYRLSATKSSAQQYWRMDGDLENSKIFFTTDVDTSKHWK